MYQLWEIVIAPVLRAARVKRVVEIGALTGETTTRLVDLLGADPGAELHVIDPEPQFDPAEHEGRFAGRYVLHREPSHAALPRLGAMDAALIDGDHNWHTVHGELEFLAAAARREQRPLPVTILHDVGWPYGRRDCYYAPERIPEEHRHPYERLGMHPGKPELVPRGGINAVLDNAVRDGGPRNGVMTALEDFAAAHDRPLRTVVIAIFFGLGIIAEEARLEAEPELALALDQLEGSRQQTELLAMAERLRLNAALGMHGAVERLGTVRQRSAERYLELLKGSLLDEHHSAYDARSDSRSGLDHLQRCLEAVEDGSVAGDLVECGVGRGTRAIFMRGVLEAHELRDRRVWVVDSFPSPADVAPDSPPANRVADVNMVCGAFHRFGLLDKRVRLLRGPIAQSLAAAPLEQVALIRIDGARVADAGAILDAVYERVAPGGFVLIDGYGIPRCRQAVDGFRERKRVAAPLREGGAGLAWWRRETGAAEFPGAGRAAIDPQAVSVRA